MGEEELETGRVLRVTIPVRQHIQLHKLRLLVGKSMSDVVRDSLDMYFRAFNADRGTDVTVVAHPPAEAESSDVLR